MRCTPFYHYTIGARTYMIFWFLKYSYAIGTTMDEKKRTLHVKMYELLIQTNTKKIK